MSQGPLRTFQQPVPVGPASPGSCASTGGRLTWATSVADARQASLGTDASACRVRRQVCDFRCCDTQKYCRGLLMSLPLFSAASNHLPQQPAGRKTADGRSSKLSMIHLPSIPTRSRHPSAAVARANRDNVPDRGPLSGRGGGTGRREAVPPSRDAPRASGGSSSSFRSGTSVSRVPKVTVSKVSPPFQCCI